METLETGVLTDSQRKYETARTDPNQSSRQTFIDNLDLEDATPYIKKVLYVPKLDPFDYDGVRVDPETTLMLIRYFPFRSKYRIKGGRSIVEVFPSAFNVDSIDDFLSTLIDHEGHHARETYEYPKIGVILDQDMSFNSEIRARENQLRKIESGGRDCSSQYTERIHRELNKLYLALVVGLSHNFAPNI